MDNTNLTANLQDKKKSAQFTDTDLIVGKQCKVLNAIFFESNSLHFASCKRCVNCHQTWNKCLDGAVKFYNWFLQLSIHVFSQITALHNFLNLPGTTLRTTTWTVWRYYQEIYGTCVVRLLNPSPAARLSWLRSCCWSVRRVKPCLLLELLEVSVRYLVELVGQMEHVHLLFLWRKFL